MLGQLSAEYAQILSKLKDVLPPNSSTTRAEASSRQHAENIGHMADNILQRLVLQFKHFELTLKENEKAACFSGQIALKHRKGHKDDPGMALPVRLDSLSLSDPGLHVVCPVSLVLILALRTGAVTQSSYDSLNSRDQKTPRPNG
ncbi:hypothetical protein AJ80_06431 [Polytolypa hystricis UAMH7299]|uniref:Uncharacterized protein n=1 Tax=Polytolypa hystricis (strain UAMH7299) TaxID=1447883 RepID=A0A2B7XW56_POLH7|nr:hypothetical protein AJ80_06431 [Polytolypa hystricis UAMH7299]